MQSDLSMFESCGPVTKLPVMASDQGDVFSRSSAGSDTLDNMDIKVDAREFEDLFCFDGGDLF